MTHECIFTLVITKLEKLLISEVSGVDDPANQLPGFMVAKASGLSASRGIGPDVEDWDVGAAEKRIRKACGATSEPNEAYASCFLWKSADGVPDSFGDYKFLVCDVVDGQVNIMPAAIRAVAKRADGSSIPASDKVELLGAVEVLKEKAGLVAATEDTPVAEDSATSTLAKIKKLLGFAGKDEVSDMTEDRLNEILDERLSAFAKGLVERLSKSEEEAPEAEAPPEAAAEETEASEEGEAEVEAEVEAEEAPAEEAPVVEAEEVEKDAEGEAAAEEAPAYLTAEGLAEALAPYNQILEKVLERLDGVDAAMTTVARKSLDGQEGVTEVEKAEGTQSETVADAIVKAFRR